MPIALRNIAIWSGIGELTSGAEALYEPTGTAIQAAIADMCAGSMADITYASTRKNTGGQMPMSWDGAIRCYKALGKKVIVYGANGIAALIPYVEPAPTYGKVDIAGFGIHSRMAVAGDDNVHIFISTDNYLWSLDGNLKLERLGYKEWIAALTGTPLVVTFDQQAKEYYISDGLKALLLTKSGLSSVGYSISSISYDTLNRVIAWIIQGSDNAQARFTTEQFDMKNRAIKTIAEVEAGVTGALTIAINYRYKGNSSFSTSRVKTVNNLGQVKPIVGGVDFRVKGVSSNYTTFSLDGLTIKWKMDDKRMIRGPYGQSKNA